MLLCHPDTGFDRILKKKKAEVRWKHLLGELTQEHGCVVSGWTTNYVCSQRSGNRRSKESRVKARVRANYIHYFEQQHKPFLSAAGDVQGVNLWSTPTWKNLQLAGHKDVKAVWFPAGTQKVEDPTVEKRKAWFHSFIHSPSGKSPMKDRHWHSPAYRGNTTN